MLVESFQRLSPCLPTNMYAPGPSTDLTWSQAIVFKCSKIVRSRWGRSTRQEGRKKRKARECHRNRALLCRLSSSFAEGSKDVIARPLISQPSPREAFTPIADSVFYVFCIASMFTASPLFHSSTRTILLSRSRSRRRKKAVSRKI